MQKKINLQRQISCLLLQLILMGCARYGTLNFKQHNYGAVVNKIVWLQVAGMELDHIAMIRFSRSSVFDVTSFEKSGCIGELWNYNLFKMRPSAYAGFLAQLVGKKNITQTCTDYSHQPIWEHVTLENFSTGIFETNMPRTTAGVDSLSLASANSCGTHGVNFLKNTILWRMEKLPENLKVPLAKRDLQNFNEFYFHLQDGGRYSIGQQYFDRSCQQGECFSSILQNVEHTFTHFKANKTHYLYLIRDFSYLNSLQRGKILEARETLAQVEKIYDYFLKELELNPDMLLLLSSSEGQALDFPAAGKEWENFELQGKNVLFKHTSLLSPLLARGAQAENFCGIYEEAEVLMRVIGGQRINRPSSYQ